MNEHSFVYTVSLEYTTGWWNFKVFFWIFWCQKTWVRKFTILTNLFLERVARAPLDSSCELSNQFYLKSIYNPEEVNHRRSFCGMLGTHMEKDPCTGRQETYPPITYPFFSRKQGDSPGRIFKPSCLWGLHFKRGAEYIPWLVIWLSLLIFEPPYSEALEGTCKHFWACKDLWRLDAPVGHADCEGPGRFGLLGHLSGGKSWRKHTVCMMVTKVC